MTCANCGSHLHGRFCSDCGQEARDVDLSLGEMVRELLGNLMSFDSRVWRTIRPLLFRPGDLTARYLAGQRVRFVPPVRLYVFSSIVYFLLLALLAPGAIEMTPEVQEGDREEVVREEAAEEVDRDEASTPDFFPRVAEDPEGFRRQFVQGLSYLMFFLVPVFGGLLKLAYLPRRRPYLHHLLFAVHLHAFVFLVFAAGVLMEASGWGPLGQLGELLAFLIPIYLFMALRKVYGGRRWTTLLRTGFLGALYLVTLSLSVALLVVGIRALWWS